MTLQLVFYSILSAAVWRVSTEDDILAYGYEGSGVEIRCPYYQGYEDHGKYLCTVNCASSDIVVATEWEVSRAENGRFSLYHDTSRREFIVHIHSLAPTDAGTYWCGVSRTGKDYYSKVLLNITKDWCCVNPTFMQAKSPAPVSITCPYEPQYDEREKYFCKGKRPSACLQQALVTSQKNNTGRISLYDNKKAKAFTVTITGLKKEDSGMYMCGIRINPGLDVYTLVNLEVKETTTTTSLAPTTTPFLSSSSPPLPSTILSSTNRKIVLQTLIDEPTTGGTSMFIQWVSISVAVLVFVAFVAFIIIFRCKRKKRLGSAGPIAATGLSKVKEREAAVDVKLAFSSAELQRETGVFEDIYVNTEVTAEVKRKHPNCEPEHNFQPDDESVYENFTANNDYH